MSIALARKYRPKNFASVAVQTHVADTLKGAIAHDRVAHAYLLCGPRGTGKTTLARVLAMALNCERRGEAALNGEPCGECDSCRRIWNGSASMDVVEIDAASNRGVDDARELRERAMYAPSGDDRYKVYIVDEAHMLTREAWNALLKILEEPPPRVVFVFATTEPQKIAQSAAPVLSRVQTFHLKRIGPAEIRERLEIVLNEEGVEFERDALAMISRAADGGLRDALSLTDQVLSLGDTTRVTADRVRVALGLVPEDVFLELLDLIADRRAADVFPVVQRLADSGADFALVLSGLGDMLRAQLATLLGGEMPEISDRLRSELKERKARFNTSDLLRMLQALIELEPLYRKSGQPQLLLETLLLRLALLDRTVQLEEVLRGFGTAESAEPPSRRVSKAETKVAPAYATTSLVQDALVPVAPIPQPIPRSATQVAAEAAAATQEAAAHAPPEARTSRTREERGPVAPPSIDAIRKRWSEVPEFVKKSGRGFVSAALGHLVPESINAAGVLIIGYERPNDTWATAVESARSDVMQALQATFEGINGFALRVVGEVATGSQGGKRLTAEDVQQQRTDHLTNKHPLLGAAVQSLDLELLD
ncbi:MAG: DNA polymerase III subunit gamma/tau [Phycisphaerae bacterium]|nr:DNA polymerase III subunit gamma/tau [Gemmatimonadaceae bacterium]